VRCVAIGGEPATGKTTLVSEIYRNLNKPRNLKYGLVRGHVDQERNLALLGIYNTGDLFLGTDKLAMNVNPHFHKYIGQQNRNILFEGDRLFTKANIEALNTLYETRIIILNASQQTLDDRHIARGDSQSEKFLAGRKTKIANIKAAFPDQIEDCELLTEADTSYLCQDLLEWLSHK